VGTEIGRVRRGAQCGETRAQTPRAGRRKSLLLDRYLDLGLPVAQTSITILPLSGPLTPRDEQPKENQQESEQSFHAFPLHGQDVPRGQDGNHGSAVVWAGEAVAFCALSSISR
jgi:hypothetical protein